MKRWPAGIAAVAAAAAWLAHVSNGWALYEPYRLRDPSRRWEVTLGTSVGYDDNINTVEQNPTSSFTTSVEPELLLNVPFEQSFLGLRYRYNLAYYDQRIANQIDQSHSADVLYSHTFSPRFSLDLQNQFRHGLNPDLVQVVAGVPLVTELRGNYNYDALSGTLSYGLTRRCSISLDAGGEYWRFDEAKASMDNDRNSDRIGISSLYAVSPRFQVGGGYRYTRTDYREDLRIPVSFFVQVISAEARSSDTHEGFLAVVGRFNPQLSGRLTVGGQFQEFGDGTQSSSPSVDSSLTYNYGPQNTITAGFRYSIRSAELSEFRSSESALLYGEIGHWITSRCRAALSGSYNIDMFQNPTVTLPPPVPDSEDSLSVSLGLTYEFRSWCRATCNFTHTEVTSDLVSRSFQRNVVGVGVRFIY